MYGLPDRRLLSHTNQATAGIPVIANTIVDGSGMTAETTVMVPLFSVSMTMLLPEGSVRVVFGSEIGRAHV